MDTHTIFLLLPLVAAILWGVNYAVSGHTLKFLSVPTAVFVHGSSYIVASLLLMVFIKEPIDFSPYFTHPDRMWTWLMPLSAGLAICCVFLSIRATSSTYYAIVEISYVIFTPLFAYLFFGARQWSPASLIGAALMIAGLIVVVWDQSQKSPQPPAAL